MKTRRSIIALVLPLALSTQLSAQTFDRVTIKAPATYYPGPSWLNVGSDVPARMWVIWPPISNAAGYRISRSVNGGNIAPAEVIPSSAVYAHSMGVQYPHVLPSDDSLALYGLQINAFFLNGTDTTWSGPSPVSSARSMPNRPPSNLRYTVQRSTNKKGILRVSLSWDKWYTGVRGYSVRIWISNMMGAEYNAIPATQTSVVIDWFPSTNESFGQLAYEIGHFTQTKVCVATRWPTATVPLSPWACTPNLN